MLLDRCQTYEKARSSKQHMREHLSGGFSDDLEERRDACIRRLLVSTHTGDVECRQPAPGRPLVPRSPNRPDANIRSKLVVEWPRASPPPTSIGRQCQ